MCQRGALPAQVAILSLITSGTSNRHEAFTDFLNEPFGSFRDNAEARWATASPQARFIFSDTTNERLFSTARQTSSLTTGSHAPTVVSANLSTMNPGVPHPFT
jgi:hypothetical protein